MNPKDYDDALTVREGWDSPELGDARPRKSGDPEPYGIDELFGLREESEKGVKDYLDVVLRRKWVVLAVFALIAVLAAAYAYELTPIYSSHATVEIGAEQKHPIKNIGEAFFRNWLQAEVYSTQMQILGSRSLAAAVVDRMNLAETPEFQSPLSGEDPSFKSVLDKLKSSVKSFLGRYLGGKPPSTRPKETKESRKNALINDFLSRVSTERPADSRLIKLGMLARDPVMAKELLTNFIDLYIQENLRKRRQQNEEANDWLKAELKRSEKKLVDSLAALVKFTRKHGMVSLDSGSDQALRFFNRAADGLVESKEKRVQLETSLGSLEGQRGDLLPAGVKSMELGRLHDKVYRLESEYTGMREIYSDSYPKVAILKKQITGLRKRIGELEKSAMSAALDNARQKELLRQKTFEQAKNKAMNANSLGIRHEVLKKEIETNEQVYRILLQKSKELEVNTQTIGNNIELVDTPSLPLAPVKPKKDVIVFIGALMGLVGGLAVALLLDQLDDKVRSTQDIEKSLSLPNLGMVPDMNKLKSRLSFKQVEDREFLAYDSPKSPVSEAIRNIKTSIFLSVPATSINTIVVSSALPAEGKTFLAVSIATAMSSNSKRVLVVDTDLRRPRIAKIFNHHTGGTGLTTLLTGDDTRLAKIIHRSRVPGLYYVPAGPVPPNPAGLLESDRMLHIVGQVREMFDLVVFDSPPVVGFSDTLILASYVDATILVARDGHVPVEVLRDAKNMVTMTKGKILGVVLNMVDGATGRYGRYGRYKYRSYHKYYRDYGDYEAET